MARVDPEIAAATLKQHVEDLWATGRPAQHGWEYVWLDSLQLTVKMPAHRQDGGIDHYHIRLGGEYYDAGPPTVSIIDPATGQHALKNSKWFPRLKPPHWFGLHDAYSFPGQGTRQLVCFSGTAEYYLTNHSPKETEKWKQGRHTIALTLNRLQEILSPPHYLGTSQ